MKTPYYHGVIHYLLKSQVSMISGKLKKKNTHFLKAEDYDKNYFSFKVSTKYEPKAATRNIMIFAMICIIWS